MTGEGGKALRKEKAAGQLIYKGPSMKPLFHDLDFLTVFPCRKNDLRPGDVVLFKAPDTGEPVVHRVLSFKKDMIRTKGDNNREMDGHHLQFHDIRGKVVLVSRPGRTFRVVGGGPGLFFHYLLRAASFLWEISRHVLRPLWRVLVFFRPLRWVLMFLPDKRIVSYKRPEGEERLWLIGSYPGARRKTSETQWKISRFFQLVVDSETLLKQEKP